MGRARAQMTHGLRGRGVHYLHSREAVVHRVRLPFPIAVIAEFDLRFGVAAARP